jgi:hypothetical protein
MWKKYNTIADSFRDLWDDRVARGSVTLDSRLLRVAERMDPDAKFEYGLLEVDGQPSSLILNCVKNGIATVGTPETSGLHFWYDERRFSEESFLKEVMSLYGNGENIVFFDFTWESVERWGKHLETNGFQLQSALDLSMLTIPETIGNLEEYASVLNARHRYRWNQCRAALDLKLYDVETITDFMPILDELYPLYVEVSERAEEYRAEPYSKDYFRVVKEEFGDDAVTVIIREKSSSKILGFMLLLYGKASCVHQYIGFHRRDELFLWHNLTIESIGDALRREVRQINMGVTHAEAKHKFGAISKEMFNFTKNKSNR